MGPYIRHPTSTSLEPDSRQPPAAPAPVRVSPRCANTARGQLEEVRWIFYVQEASFEAFGGFYKVIIMKVCYDFKTSNRDRDES